MSRYYILVEKEAVPVSDVLEWAKSFEDRSRTVAKDKVGEVEISTVFLGLDHRYGKGKPLIFETMVFGGELNKAMERYSTWEEAEEGHKTMIGKVEASAKGVK